MRSAIDETSRRREKQVAYNEEHGITPTTVIKGVRNVIRGEEQPEEIGSANVGGDRDALTAQLTDLELDMWQASEDLDFERAASLRDQIRAIEAKLQGKEFKQATVPGQRCGRAVGGNALPLSAPSGLAGSAGRAKTLDLLQDPLQRQGRSGSHSGPAL